MSQSGKPRETGTVKFFNEAKGFGFISTASGDVFVHAKGLSAGLTRLADGCRVSFEKLSEQRGPRAVDVRVEK